MSRAMQRQLTQLDRCVLAARLSVAVQGMARRRETSWGQVLNMVTQEKRHRALRAWNRQDRALHRLLAALEGLAAGR